MPSKKQYDLVLDIGIDANTEMPSEEAFQKGLQFHAKVYCSTFLDGIIEKLCIKLPVVMFDFLIICYYLWVFQVFLVSWKFRRLYFWGS